MSGRRTCPWRSADRRRKWPPWSKRSCRSREGRIACRDPSGSTSPDAGRPRRSSGFRRSSRPASTRRRPSGPVTLPGVGTSPSRPGDDARPPARAGGFRCLVASPLPRPSCSPRPSPAAPSADPLNPVIRRGRSLSVTRRRSTTRSTAASPETTRPVRSTRQWVPNRNPPAWRPDRPIPHAPSRRPCHRRRPEHPTSSPRKPPPTRRSILRRSTCRRRLLSWACRRFPRNSPLPPRRSRLPCRSRSPRPRPRATPP